MHNVELTAAAAVSRKRFLAKRSEQCKAAKREKDVIETQKESNAKQQEFLTEKLGRLACKGIF